MTTPVLAALERYADDLAEVESSPAEGRLQLLVRRPSSDVREVLASGRLDEAVGLVGHIRRV